MKELTAMYETDLGLPGRRQGKVRDLYDLPVEGGEREGEADRLLLVATDRLSAFDVVMPTPFAGKGALLTDISLRWFRWVEESGLIGHHVVGTGVDDLPVCDEMKEALAGRIMICRKTAVVPIECVARGYLAGSGYKDYCQSGKVCGIDLPDGMGLCDQLDEAIFTPAAKASVGHDVNITI